MGQDSLADGGGIDHRGSNIQKLADTIMENILTAQENLSPATPGLKTPGAFESMASEWVSHCDNLSNTIRQIGSKVIKAGENHVDNDERQSHAIDRSGRNMG